jgi:hypothetical protein
LFKDYKEEKLNLTETVNQFEKIVSLVITTEVILSVLPQSGEDFVTFMKIIMENFIKYLGKQFKEYDSLNDYATYILGYLLKSWCIKLFALGHYFIAIKHFMKSSINLSMSSRFYNLTQFIEFTERVYKISENSKLSTSTQMLKKLEFISNLLFDHLAMNTTALDWIAKLSDQAETLSKYDHQLYRTYLRGSILKESRIIREAVIQFVNCFEVNRKCLPINSFIRLKTISKQLLECDPKKYLEVFNSIKSDFQNLSEHTIDDQLIYSTLLYYCAKAYEKSGDKYNFKNHIQQSLEELEVVEERIKSIVNCDLSLIYNNILVKKYQIFCNKLLQNDEQTLNSSINLFLLLKNLNINSRKLDHFIGLTYTELFENFEIYFANYNKINTQFFTQAKLFYSDFSESTVETNLSALDLWPPNDLAYLLNNCDTEHKINEYFSEKSVLLKMDVLKRFIKNILNKSLEYFEKSEDYLMESIVLYRLLSSLSVNGMHPGINVKIKSKHTQTIVKYFGSAFEKFKKSIDFDYQFINKDNICEFFKKLDENLEIYIKIRDINIRNIYGIIDDFLLHISIVLMSQQEYELCDQYLDKFKARLEDNQQPNDIQKENIEAIAEIKGKFINK